MSRLPFLFLPLIVMCLFSGCCTMPGQGPPCPDITGSWILVSYSTENDSLVPVPPTDRITAVFGKDSRVSGNAGCNDYFGEYTVEGGLISIGPLASTEKYCLSPEGVMEREQIYLSLLQTSTRFNVDGDELVLSYYDQKQLLVFRKE
jgi:heat shock protein HslJ